MGNRDTARSGRYARQTMLPEIGIEGQERLAGASVLVIGLGGLGSPAALYLAGAGIGRIGLADPDTVSESNLQRQTLYEVRQIGMPKTEAARQRLSAFSPDTAFECHPDGLTAENAAEIVGNYDVIVDCCDNFPTRYLIDDVCASCGRPWIYGSIGAFSGQVSVMNYISGRRYSDLYPDRESLCARPREISGVIGTVPGVIGTIEASEALKIIAGFGRPLDGRLLTVDLLTLETEMIEF